MSAPENTALVAPDVPTLSLWLDENPEYRAAPYITPRSLLGLRGYPHRITRVVVVAPTTMTLGMVRELAVFAGRAR